MQYADIAKNFHPFYNIKVVAMLSGANTVV
jgi:hypothetical protein